MIKAFLHRVAARPAIYDLIQKFAGMDRVYRRISAQLPPLKPAAVVLDVGGGTGLSYRSLRLAAAHYVCLDVDPVKVIGFRQKFPEGMGVQGDALQLPIPTGSVDMVVMIAVSHHLPDGILEGAVQEIIRVLNPGGSLIFLDPIWAPTNLAGRLIWSLDRGAYPRTQEQLQQVLSAHGQLIHAENFRILHRYVLCIVTPAQAAVNALMPTAASKGS